MAVRDSILSIVTHKKHPSARTTLPAAITSIGTRPANWAGQSTLNSKRQPGDRGTSDRNDRPLLEKSTVSPFPASELSFPSSAVQRNLPLTGKRIPSRRSCFGIGGMFRAGSCNLMRPSISNIGSFPGYSAESQEIFWSVNSSRSEPAPRWVWPRTNKNRRIFSIDLSVNLHIRDR